MTDWTGRPVITGIGQELLDRLPRDAVAGAPRGLWGSTDSEAVAYWRERQGAYRDTVTWSPMIDPHCLNTGWLWAGVDFARWLRFKRPEPEAHRQGAYLQAGAVSSTDMAGAPPRGPKVSITADTPAL
jgi:hypothetical protein